jgi:hypothetical protein
MNSLDVRYAPGLAGRAILSVLAAELDCVVLRSYLPPHVARRLRDAFDLVVNQLQPRDDLVRAKTVGGQHFGKPLTDYIRDAPTHQAGIDRVFQIAETDPLEAIMAEVATQADGQPAAACRRATYNGHPAVRGRIVEWQSDEPDYLLGPHDDVAQLTDPLQAHFEIQECVDRPVAAVNLYLSTLALGGGLRLWDFHPDDEMRTELDISSTGYPYGDISLGGIDYQDFVPTAGDLIIVNGHYVHAALAGSIGRRVLLNLFVGQNAQGDVIYWS